MLSTNKKPNFKADQNWYRRGERWGKTWSTKPRLLVLCLRPPTAITALNKMIIYKKNDCEVSQTWWKVTLNKEENLPGTCACTIRLESIWSVYFYTIHFMPGHVRGDTTKFSKSESWQQQNDFSYIISFFTYPYPYCNISIMYGYVCVYRHNVMLMSPHHQGIAVVTQGITWPLSLEGWATAQYSEAYHNPYRRISWLN